MKDSDLWPHSLDISVAVEMMAATGLSLDLLSNVTAAGMEHHILAARNSMGRSRSCLMS